MYISKRIGFTKCYRFSRIFYLLDECSDICKFNGSNININSQKAMEQTPSQNKNLGMTPQNQNYLIAAGIIIVLAIIFFVVNARNDEGTPEDNQAQNQQEEQVSGENTDQNGEETPSMEPTDSPDSEDSLAGNVSAAGTLRVSDDSTRGNLMMGAIKARFISAPFAISLL